MPVERDPQLHRDRRRADSFGDDAELYDQIRPTYPAELIDTLTAEHPRSVLDVGCGTGITGRLLAARGCEVLGIESDARMAAVARRRGLSVEESPFERWDSRGRRFDLLTAGQSWHWIDPDLGLEQAARTVTPGGRIGLFWNDSFPHEEARSAIDPVYAAVSPELGQRAISLGGHDSSHYDRIGELIEGSPHFTDVAVLRFSHGVHYSSAQWVALLRTHSDHHTLPPAELDELLRALEPAIEAVGGVPVRYVTTLVTGVRESD